MFTRYGSAHKDFYTSLHLCTNWSILLSQSDTATCQVELDMTAARRPLLILGVTRELDSECSLHFALPLPHTCGTRLNSCSNDKVPNNDCHLPSSKSVRPRHVLCMSFKFTIYTLDVFITLSFTGTAFILRSVSGEARKPWM